MRENKKETDREEERAVSGSTSAFGTISLGSNSPSSFKQLTFMQEESSAGFWCASIIQILNEKEKRERKKEKERAVSGSTSVFGTISLRSNSPAVSRVSSSGVLRLVHWKCCSLLCMTPSCCCILPPALFPMLLLLSWPGFFPVLSLAAAGAARPLLLGCIRPVSVGRAREHLGEVVVKGVISNYAQCLVC